VSDPKFAALLALANNQDGKAPLSPSAQRIADAELWNDEDFHFIYIALKVDKPAATAASTSSAAAAAATTTSAPAAAAAAAPQASTASAPASATAAAVASSSAPAAN
jgi:hypothetical protein